MRKGGANKSRRGLSKVVEKRREGRKYEEIGVNFKRKEKGGQKKGGKRGKGEEKLVEARRGK